MQIGVQIDFLSTFWGFYLHCLLSAIFSLLFSDGAEITGGSRGEINDIYNKEENFFTVFFD